MSRENSSLGFAERECQSMKELVRAVPNVFVWTDAEAGFELFSEFLSNGAIHAIGANQQIAVSAKCFDVGDLSAKVDLNIQLFATLLQNLQQPKPSDARKTIAMN